MLPVRIFTRGPLAEMGKDALTRPLSAMESLLDNVENCCSPSMRVDVREEEARYIVEADLPGFTKDDLDITIENEVLTLAAEKSEEKENQEVISNESYHVRERRSGKVTRMLTLPQDVDSSSISASLKHGVLTVILNKAESAKPHKIEITGE